MGNRNKKVLQISVLSILGLFLIYNSVFFENLDERKNSLVLEKFDPAEYVKKFWHNRLPSTSAKSTPATDLLNALKMDIVSTGEKFGRTLGLASTYYFLLSGKGQIIDITDEGIVLSIFRNQKNPDILIATNYIFGNAIRDACGLIDVSDFPSSMEFNNISSEINKVVSREVIPSFIEKITIGDDIFIFGAAEVNKNEPEINPLKVIPIQVIIHE